MAKHRRNRQAFPVTCKYCRQVATGRHRIGWTWCPAMQGQYQAREATRG